MREITGSSSAVGGRFAIAASRFNESVVGNLVDGACRTLLHSGASEEDILVVWCPGAVELPILVQRLAATGKFDAVLAMGCVIRGGTPHFDYVASVASEGLARVALDSGVPVAFGVLTCDTTQQALDRSAPVGSGDGSSGQGSSEQAKWLDPEGGLSEGTCNKGVEAAQAAVEMVGLLAAIQEERGN